MNLIASLLKPEDVLVTLSAPNKKQIFEQAGVFFEQRHGISQRSVTDSLLSREKLGSTGLGQGIAIPHGRIKGLKEAMGAFVRLSQPIPFDAPDGRSVSLIFILLVPEQANEHHLQLLSELAQMFSDRTFREQLMSAPDADAIHTLFAGWSSHAPDKRRPAI